MVVGGSRDAGSGGVGEALRAQGLTPADGASIDGWSALEFRAPVHDRA